ncbi:MAG: ankyrin repeat domain-containing protein [Endozoicomonadaceae bacterium]|nr:ankyrin repeat domain-containing protein [Endozoicomonadaceae bacterium]
MNNDKMKLLGEAISTHDINKFNQILSSLEEDINNINICELVFLCVTQNNDLAFKKFVSRGLDLSRIEGRLLVEIGAHGSLLFFNILKEHGIDVHNHDEIMLRTASRFGHIKLVKELATSWSNIHILDDAALRGAAEKGHLDIVEFLIIRGANCFAGKPDAIALSVVNEHLDVASFLLRHSDFKDAHGVKLNWSRWTTSVEIKSLLTSLDHIFDHPASRQIKIA